MPPCKNAATSSSKQILNRQPFRTTAARNGPWDRGSPPAARISAAPIGCRGRCRRIAAPSPRTSWDVPFAADFVSGETASRSAAWKRRLRELQPLADRVCGPAFHCQHRCCHCPRLPSLVGGTSQLNARLHGKVASGWCESDVPMLRFTAFALQTGAFHQTKVKKSHPASNPKVASGVPSEVVAALGH
jgi:hypothetical protein